MSPATRPIANGPGTHSRRVTIVVFTVAVFLYWIALYLYMPTLPTYVESKTRNLALVGVVLSMYGLWQAIVRLPLGILSDWIGRRKPFIVGGFLVTALGAGLMGASDSITGEIIGRVITGMAAGTWVPLVVLFSSLFPRDEAVRASALLTMVGSVARVVATSSTGALNESWGYSLAFFLASGAAILAALVVLPTREVRRAPKPPSWASVGRLLGRRDVLLPSLLSALGQYANWAATFGFLPILAKQLGATDVLLSALMSGNMVIIALGNLTTTTIVKRIGARSLVYIGFGFLALGGAGAALARSLPIIFLSQACIGLSMGISYPVFMGMSIRNVDEAERTTAMGLHQSIYAVGMFAGPAVSGILAEAMGIRGMLGLTAGVCLLVGVLATRGLGDRPAAGNLS